MRNPWFFPVSLCLLTGCTSISHRAVLHSCTEYAQLDVALKWRVVSPTAKFKADILEKADITLPTPSTDELFWLSASNDHVAVCWIRLTSNKYPCAVVVAQFERRDGLWVEPQLARVNVNCGFTGNR